MKLLLIGLFALTSFSAFSLDTSLDGLSFCRSVPTGGLFGQPVGTRSHCIKFSEGKATDNANTFFGNPPASYFYSVENQKVINLDRNKATGYVIFGKDLKAEETGAILTRME